MFSNRRETSPAASAGRHRTGSTDSTVAGPSLLPAVQPPEGSAGVEEGHTAPLPSAGKGSSSSVPAVSLVASVSGGMVDPDPDLLSGAPWVKGGSSSPQLPSEDEDEVMRRGAAPDDARCLKLLPVPCGTQG